MDADRNVGFAHGQIEFAIVDDQGQLDIGEVLDELADPRGQPTRAQSGGGGDHQRAFGLGLAFGDQRFGLVEPRTDFADRAIQRLALLGKDQAAGVAMEQGAFKLSSSALIWRLIADWLSRKVSPACVKLPASATAWKIRSLSQSTI